MNNKDLFNAINDIDEKFITDAGKYLKNDFGGFREDEPIEIRPAETNFSPMRWIAPIAAAIVLFVGIGVALRAGIITIKLQPLRQQAGADSAVYGPVGGSAANGYIVGSDVNSYVGGSDEAAVVQNLNTAPSASGGGTGTYDAQTNSMRSDISRIEAEMSDNLPFMLYGPDLEQIKYSEVTFFAANEYSEKFSAQDLTEDNWSAIECDGFAYINEPRGANYNSIEIPGMFNDDVHFSDRGSISRIYKGDTFGDLTVEDAYCLFRKNTATDDKWTMPQAALKQNYVSFSGEISAEGFLIKDEEGGYRFIMCGGERLIPAMNFFMHSVSGTFTTEMAYENINGYQYMGEIPSIEVDLDEKWEKEINNYFPGRNWQKALVTLSNIRIVNEVTDIVESDDRLRRLTEYSVFAKVENVVPDFVFSYDDTTGRDCARDKIEAVINEAETIEELNALGDMIRGEFNARVEYFRVFYPVDTADGSEVEYLENGELTPGMLVYLYDRNDDVIQIYTYRK